MGCFRSVVKIRICLRQIDQLLKNYHIDDITEVELSQEIHLSPSRRTDLLYPVGQREIAAAAFGALQALGQNAGVVVNDAVRQQSGAFAPHLLLQIGAGAQLGAVGMGHGANQLVIGLAVIQRALDIALNASESESRSRWMLRKAVPLRQRSLRTIAPRVGTELADDDALAGDLGG